MTEFQPDRPKISDPSPKIHGIGHPHIDRRMLALARLVAERIDREPELLQVAVKNLKRWERMHKDGLSVASAEWKTIIEGHSWPEIRAMLVQDNDEGQRLRSSSPFGGIVSEAEWKAIVRAHPRLPADRRRAA